MYVPVTGGEGGESTRKILTLIGNDISDINCQNVFKAPRKFRRFCWKTSDPNFIVVSRIPACVGIIPVSLNSR